MMKSQKDNQKLAMRRSPSRGMTLEEARRLLNLSRKWHWSFPTSSGRRTVRIGTLAVLLLACFLVLGPNASAVAGFTMAVALPVPPDFGQAEWLDVASNSNRIRVAWVGRSNDNRFAWGYAASNDGGFTFSSKSPDTQADVVPGPSLRVVVLPNGEFLFARVNLTGFLTLAVETADGNLQDMSPLTPPIRPMEFDIATEGPLVYILWTDLLSETLVVATLNAASSATDRRAVVDAFPSTQKIVPAIAVRQGHAFALWARHNLPAMSPTAFFSYRLSPVQWAPPLRVTNETSSVVGSYPSVMPGANGSVIVLYEEEGFRLVEGRSVPPYDRFDVTRIVRPLRTTMSYAFGGTGQLDSKARIQLAYIERIPSPASGVWSVMYMESAAFSDAWSTPIVVAEASVTDLRTLAISVDPSDRVHLGWLEFRTGPGEPRYVRSIGTPGFTWLLLVTVAIASAAVGVGIVLVFRRRRRNRGSA